MNISTVADNLRNTIAGKEKMLAEYQEARKANDENWSGDARITDASLFATIEFLKINIDELRRILQDVEHCAKQASDDSWITNPDRMGGCYSEDELRNEGWK